MPGHLDNLPFDLLPLITQDLDIISVVNLSRSSSALYDAYENEHLNKIAVLVCHPIQVID
jgi:hypothetical protein